MMGLVVLSTFSLHSGRGTELIVSNVELPGDSILWEDNRLANCIIIRSVLGEWFCFPLIKE